MKKKLYILGGLLTFTLVGAVVYGAVQLVAVQTGSNAYEPVSKRRALERQANNLAVAQQEPGTTTITVPPLTTPLTPSTSGATASGTTATPPAVLGVNSVFSIVAPVLTCVNGKYTAQLSWGALANATGYTVEKKVTGSSDSTWVALSGRLPATTLSFTDSNVAAGSWSYQIHGFVGKKNMYTDEITIQGRTCTSTATTPPPAPVTPPPAPAPTPTPTPPAPVSSAKMNWGAYVGWRTSDLPAFESVVGKQVNMQATFVHWGNEKNFPTELAAPLKSAGKTLVIFWEAMDYNLDPTNQPAFSYDKILAGNYDTYVKQFAAQAKAYGGPVILIPFEEMNGDWYPWSGTLNGNTPAKHIAAYRKVHDLFAGVTNVKFGWSVNSDSVPETAANKIEAYYPGDAYVDYVGVNGFNFSNPWLTWDEVFGPALTKLALYNKPTYIFSMASASGTQKAAWITTGLSTSLQKYPKVAGWVWFNENKERDWRVNSDAASLSAFKAVLPQ